jgi:NADH:ubiquinone oxidoreductase subunit
MDDIPRHKEENPFGYSAMQLAKRNKAIRDAIKDYPHLPEMWIAWMYDLIENKPEEEVEKIINERLWETEPKERQDGGVLKCCEIIENKNDATN